MLALTDYMHFLNFLYKRKDCYNSLSVILHFIATTLSVSQVMLLLSLHPHLFVELFHACSNKRKINIIKHL